MDKTMLISQWLTEPLLTPKHDPGNLRSVCAGYRTVLSASMAQQLTVFLQTGQFRLSLYENTDPNQSKDYYVIEPQTPDFSVPASGVPRCSPYPTTDCDRLVVVSGDKQGWHIFGEDSVVIFHGQKAGHLVFKGDIT